MFNYVTSDLAAILVPFHHHREFPYNAEDLGDKAFPPIVDIFCEKWEAK